MVFSSIIFLFLFLPLALAGYYLLHASAPRVWKHLFLTLCSYVFYGWSNPVFMPLMLLSTGIDYLCGRWMTDGFGSPPASPLPLLERGGARRRAQRHAVTVSVLSNLALLGFFKYFNFGLDSWNALATAWGWEAASLDLTLRIALPLGISFYTFQSMSYTIDVYRGDARAIRNFTDFACYVSMFPQLVAGPIVRFQEVADQILERRHTMEKFARGVAFFSLGMAKKILLADPCGRLADHAFDAVQRSPADAWTGLVAYACQIYFDFSGYSDMAIGLGLMLGFTFAKNFDSPYRAASVTEFWRRWHLSLSNWLRDYLYIPLGGNRRGTVRTVLNLTVVMLLGGLWHGASWNFVLWGGMHALALIVERAAGGRSHRPGSPRLRPLRIGLTFGWVLLTWVPFRAPTLDATLGYWRSLFTPTSGVLGAEATALGLLSGMMRTPYHLATLAVALATAFFGVQTWDLTRRISASRAVAAILLFLVAVALLVATAFHPFIYFIF